MILAKMSLIDMKIPILFLGLFCLFAVQAEGIYKTVDKDGNVLFSDTPSPGAEEVELPEIQIIKSIKLEDLPSFPVLDKVEKGEERYQSITIIEPEESTGLRSNSGDFKISVALEPALKASHRLVITMDGEEVANGVATSISIQNADRGTHQLEARVVDTEDETLISTNSSFTLLRTAQ